MKRIFKVFNLYEWIFIIVCYALIITLGIVYKSNVWEIVSTLFGLTAASLNVKSNPHCFYFYSVYALSYGIISFINHQYGEGILNLVYNLPLYCFTIWNLFFRKKESSQKFIGSLKKNHWLIVIFLIPSVTFGYGYILKILNSNLPFINAMATSFSIIASFLASRLIKEQWIFWIGYSAISIYIWIFNFTNTGDTGLLYFSLNIIYVILNLKGLFTWYKLYKKQEF